jgi:hypothetical protein
MNSLPFSRRLLLVALGCIGLAGCNRSDLPATPKPDTPAAKTATAAAPAPAGDWNRLRGRWLRPDGGYVLEIRSVADDGRADAAYFNPNPIHVAWARIANTGGVLKLDAELRDVNYPGCLYKLSYVPERDQLVGTYFQAQMQETHEIFFVREQQ